MLDLLKITIDPSAKPKYLQIDYLASDKVTVVGTEYLTLWQIVRFKDELDGWWFNRVPEDEHNQKIYYSQVVSFNGHAVMVFPGQIAYAQSAITDDILAAIGKQAQQV